MRGDSLGLLVQLQVGEHSLGLSLYKHHVAIESRRKKDDLCEDFVTYFGVDETVDFVVGSGGSASS